MLSIGPVGLVTLAASDELRIGAAVTGRFYGSGIVWALALPLPELIRWNHLIRGVRDMERGR